jgi:hypothetical protein
MQSDISRCGCIDLTALSGVPADAIEIGEDFLVCFESLLTELFVNLVTDFLALDMRETDLNCIDNIQGASLLLSKKATNDSIVSVLSHLVLCSG